MAVEVFFLSAALTAKNSPELHFRFINYFIYPIISSRIFDAGSYSESLLYLGCKKLILGQTWKPCLKYCSQLRSAHNLQNMFSTWLRALLWVKPKTRPLTKLLLRWKNIFKSYLIRVTCQTTQKRHLKKLLSYLEPNLPIQSCGYDLIKSRL